MTEDCSEPFEVRIVEDCRDSEEYGIAGKLDRHYGVCLGLYEYPETWKKDDNGNPLIRVDSGDYIWGNECWWTSEIGRDELPLDLMQRVLEEHKKLVLRRATLGEISEN